MGKGRGKEADTCCKGPGDGPKPCSRGWVGGSSAEEEKLSDGGAVTLASGMRDIDGCGQSGNSKGLLSSRAAGTK